MTRFVGPRQGQRAHGADREGEILGFNNRVNRCYAKNTVFAYKSTNTYKNSEVKKNNASYIGDDEPQLTSKGLPSAAG